MRHGAKSKGGTKGNHSMTHELRRDDYLAGKSKPVIEKYVFNSDYLPDFFKQVLLSGGSPLGRLRGSHGRSGVHGH